VLGSGNPAIAGQNFTLQNAPVTYLAAQPGVSGSGYSSTITLWVNGVQWTEVPTFYGQGPTAQVFVTQEDTSGNTHVLGGDGINGARFPSGTNNIVANYRIGSGAALPPPTSISVLLQPQPGLQALVNPVPPSGGADAASASALRQLAPQSVVTFGRAVSVDDYAAIAAATPGVARVSAAYVFDPVQQRPVVTLWVGDDSSAVGKAQAAIAPISDPNRPISIKPANPVQISIALTFVRDPRYLDAVVLAGVQAALADPSVGLFGSNVVQIGQIFYDSQIYAACLKVPGVQAVHNLQVSVGPPPTIYYVWQLSSVWVRGLRRTIGAVGGCSGHQYSPGSDGFFVLQNTPAGLQLGGTPGT
jgi:predicted phage baseplate assembly protein